MLNCGCPLSTVELSRHRITRMSVDGVFSPLPQEHAQCRDSRSTISGGRLGGAGQYDYLGRPVLHNSSRRGRDRLLDRDEENRLRVETFVRNSTMSLVSVSFQTSQSLISPTNGMHLTHPIILHT